MLKGLNKDGSKPEKEEEYDLLIVGGGATGAGATLDAATRGLKVACVERDDFSAGTSSRSTKLVHGGVRYLQKAILELDYEQWKLVKEALYERKTFLTIAPYLSFPLPIMLPVYTWWQLPYYWVGCKVYDLLAGGENMESSYLLTRGKALEAFPMLKKDKLVGALVYYDGQHNDSRMNIAIALTAVHHGATVANHVEVVSLLKKPDATGKQVVAGARVRDVFTGEEWNIKAKGVVNATGPFTDGLRKMDDQQTKEIVAPSSGVHIVLPNYYSPGNMGLIDPATSDGRVIFFLPWQGNTIAGTTDSPSEVTQNPVPKQDEIDWILSEVRRYLSPDIKVRRGDVLAAWSGIRPLVRDPHAKNTESLVRNHMINVSDSNLITIAGGKWTTYRAMAQETIDKAIEVYGLKPERGSQTATTRLIGSHGFSSALFIKLIQQFGLETEVAKHLTDTYGDRAWAVAAIAEPTGRSWPVHGVRLSPNYPYLEAEVKYACRKEYAETAIDVISRRTRLSFLNATAALDALPRVIEIMSAEHGWNSKRANKEFNDALQFLQAMGLHPSKAKLTMKQVQRGEAHKLDADEDTLYQRARFQPEEIETLKGTFDRLDANKDGKIGVDDLRKACESMGYHIKLGELQDVINEVDHNKSGNIEFLEFLEAIAGMKEIQLDNAFTGIIEKMQDGSITGSGPRGSTPTQPERSGGGV